MQSVLLNRRGFLMGVGALGAIWVSGQAPGRGAAPAFAADPFSLGVASGDPLPDGVVLWTRLAPDPLKGGGLPPEAYSVQWEVATDEGMRRVVQRGTAVAAPALAHSVHVELRGLRPAAWYWYRFSIGDYTSPIGRTRTAPASRSRADRLRFAFASCANWQHGFYAAYGAMAQEDLDLVVHLGDYIYEGGPAGGGPRQHEDGPEISTLRSYRNRYALYKSDRHLQAAHAAFPWVVTWDDHEVENNYANQMREANQRPPVDFLARRMNAYQAYYEHMPLRLSCLPRGARMQLYRRLTFGDLAEFNLLDTRQYRTDQPCGDSIKPRCEAALAESQSMMGPEQERWLVRGLERSRARWNVIGQQTMMAQYDFHPLSDELFNMDQWDGYVAARRRLLDFLRDRKPSNPVVLTGDIHSSWVHDLKADFGDPKSATVGTEFVGTSISSRFDPPYIPYVMAALPGNPHTRFFDGAHRGYVRCQLTRQQWRTDFRVVPTQRETGSVLVKEAPATTLASFVVSHGRSGAEKA